MPYVQPNLNKAVGAAFGATDYNIIANDIAFLYDQTAVAHGCFLTMNTLSSLPSGQVMPILWNVEIADTDNYHSITSSPEAIVIPNGLGGVYSVTFYFRWVGVNPPDNSVAIITVNGVAFARSHFSYELHSSITLNWTGILPAGSAVDCAIYHVAGETYNIQNGTATSLDPLTPSAFLYKVG